MVLMWSDVTNTVCRMPTGDVIGLLANMDLSVNSAENLPCMSEAAGRLGQPYYLVSVGRRRPSETAATPDYDTLTGMTASQSRRRLDRKLISHAANTLRGSWNGMELRAQVSLGFRGDCCRLREPQVLCGGDGTKEWIEIGGNAVAANESKSVKAAGLEGDFEHA